MIRIVLWSIPVLLFWQSAFAGGVSDKDGVFVDASRSRQVPYKIYYPKPLDGLHAVIIVSHPIGGSRDSNKALGKGLASSGFVVVHIQHEGSDADLLKGIRDRRMVGVRLAQSLRDPRNAQNRFLDVPFVVQQLTELNANDKMLKGYLNLDALGMAGHSYGAVSTMVAAGERVGAVGASFRVSSLRAGLVLSPSPPAAGQTTERAYGDVTIPLLHVTGTADVSLLEGRDLAPADRTKPYRSLAIPNQYLLILNGAEHKDFSNEASNQKYMESIVTGAAAFFRAHLNNDKDAEAWLQNEYRKSLRTGDVFEHM
jgi:predicted dienelactone hydrolase